MSGIDEMKRFCSESIKKENSHHINVIAAL